MIKILHKRRAVMLLDQVDDPLGEVVLPAEIDAVLHVTDDDQGAHRGREVVMPIDAADLVFDEIVRLEHFANVVKIRPDADQQCMRSDSLSGALGDRADRDRMVVRSWSAADEFLQERVGDIA